MINKLRADRMQARKDGAKIKTSILTTLLGEVETNLKRDENFDVIKLIKKFIKNNEDTLSQCVGEIAINIFKTEIQILSEYLPKQLTEDEIRVIISDINKSEIKNIGIIMKHFKENYSGRYDGSVVSKIIKT